MTMSAEHFIGQQIGAYHLDRLVGTGGTSAVYQGHALLVRT